MKPVPVGQVAPQVQTAQSWFDRGNTLIDSGHYEEAVECFQRGLQLEPHAVEPRLDLGFALLQLERHEEARACYERVLAIRPRHFKALTSCAFSYLASNQKEKAISLYQLAIAAEPSNAEAHFNLGYALQESGRNEEALAAYEDSLQLKPAYPEALSNRGTVLEYLLRPEDALASYDTALCMDPSAMQTLVNRGSALQSLRRFDEALECYAQVESAQPDFADAHWNESLCRLKLGHFELGWQKYEWGWRNGQRGELRLPPEQLWLGQEPLDGKTILLHAEQGLGDTLQFCRYAMHIASLGARVKLEVQQPLATLLANLKGVDQVLVRGSSLPGFDYHCPLLSLPLALSTRLPTVPTTDAYIRSDPIVVGRWEKKLGPKSLPRVGLAWSGRPDHLNDHNRSIPLARLVAIASGSVQLVSLQKEVRTADQLVLDEHAEVLSFSDDIADFGDTAALIELMDIVITADTSVAHLAGAMGKPVWILLPGNPDWRWLIDRQDSPWYPSARLFRQETSGDWTSVVRSAAAALKDLFSSGSRI